MLKKRNLSRKAHKLNIVIIYHNHNIIFIMIVIWKSSYSRIIFDCCQRHPYERMWWQLLLVPMLVVTGTLLSCLDYDCRFLNQEESQLGTNMTVWFDLPKEGNTDKIVNFLCGKKMNQWFRGTVTTVDEKTRENPSHISMVITAQRAQSRKFLIMMDAWAWWLHVAVRLSRPMDKLLFCSWAQEARLWGRCKMGLSHVFVALSFWACMHMGKLQLFP